MTDFRIIIITPYDIVSDEARRIRMILDAGIDRVHIRHPQAGINDVRTIIDGIPEDLHHRLTIHDHVALLRDYPVLGFQLNGRVGSIEGLHHGMLSRGLHHEDPPAMALGMDYVMLSPVFDSISKQGYEGVSDIDPTRYSACGKIIALGGVTPEKFAELRSRGFSGAALLGYYWNNYRGKEKDNLKHIIKEKHRCCSL